MGETGEKTEGGASGDAAGRTVLPALFGELVRHLRLEGLPGIPSVWINEAAAINANERESVTPQASAEPVQSEPAHCFSPVVGAQLPESGTGRTPLPGGVGDPGLGDLDLGELRKLASGCVKCRLCETRNKVVFGVGNIDTPQIVFVGEGPGADEDRIGEPFVGKAGALLTAAITKGMGLRREDVYICNVVKCRPPNNRTPLPDETAACTPYLYRQLELLDPQIIVALGGPAQAALSGVQQGITKLRGRWLSWRGKKVMPTFHPAYVLRNPAAKRDFWLDLQEVMKEAGLKSPAEKHAS